MSFSVTAQKNDRRERIKALKVAFITEQLDLTTEESQSFWAVYNSFEEQTNALRYKEMRSIKKEIRNNQDTMSEADANNLIKRLTKAENNMHKLRVELSGQLLNVIPATKIIKLKIAEEDFKRKMLNEFKKRKREQQ